MSYQILDSDTKKVLEKAATLDHAIFRARKLSHKHSGFLMIRDEDRTRAFSFGGSAWWSIDCPECGGAGKTGQYNCLSCNGTGGTLGEVCPR